MNAKTYRDRRREESARMKELRDELLSVNEHLLNTGKRLQLENETYRLLLQDFTTKQQSLQLQQVQAPALPLPNKLTAQLLQTPQLAPPAFSTPQLRVASTPGWSASSPRPADAPSGPMLAPLPALSVPPAASHTPDALYHAQQQVLIRQQLHQQHQQLKMSYEMAAYNDANGAERFVDGDAGCHSG